MGSFERKPVDTVGLKVHPYGTTADEAVGMFRTACELSGLKIIELPDEPGNSGWDECGVIVSIGGDGTLLSAVRYAYPSNLPVWGINVGDLGYLTTSVMDEIGEGVERLRKGDYHIEERTMIEAKIIEEGKAIKDLVALNDIVVHRRVPSGGLMELDVELDGRFLATYESDGLIISTPTGSTGYNMSAGGSILSPTLKAFILTPICAHSFSARSLVVDDSSMLVIKPMLKFPGEVAFATAYGQEVAELRNCPLRERAEASGDCMVKVDRASSPAGLIRFEDVIFSDVLRDKLGWADSTPPLRVRQAEET